MNFPSMLIDSGYALAEKISIFMKPGYAGIAYSDGDETENRIANIIAEAQDLSIFSRELAVQCTDWPALYHLSGTRANILRPFHSILKQANVLEIGAGCGAITRYLGESGANVLALEGSPRRAAIARSRTRNLENVTVIADKFDQFQCSLRFDIITLIGVLEYAPLFTDGENPVVSMLKRVRELLNPEGRLILAIENQLGLKYFAGAAEDHTGEPMLGIEGRYSTRGPQTFGRKVLTKMLQQAGFFNQQFMAPFPDYKLPVSIITEQGLNCDTFDAAALCWQSVRRDPQLPSSLVFAPELAWSVVDANGLTLDLANSFLVVAQASAEVEHDNSILAYHYSTNGRHSRYCKETLFIQQSNDDIELIYNSLSPDAARSVEGQFILFNIPHKAKYIYGKPLALKLLQIVTRDNWHIRDVGDFLRLYLSIIKSFLAEQDNSVDFESITSLLPGICFDLVPQNIMCLPNQTYQVFDQEWTLKDNMPLGWLIFRTLSQLMYSITRFGKISRKLFETNLDFFITSFKSLGFSVTEKELKILAEMENKAQVAIHGYENLSAPTFVWNAQSPLLHESLHFAMKNQEQLMMSSDTIVNLKYKEHRYKIAHVKLNSDLRNLQHRLDNLPLNYTNAGSVSWMSGMHTPYLCQQYGSQENSIVKIMRLTLGHFDRQNRSQLHQLTKLLEATPLFDTNFYRQSDPALAASKIDPLRHYFFHGASEGRNPSPYFFTSWYLAEYPDVASSGINPLFHFLMYGAHEGRNPNPYFFTSWYLNKYIHVKKQKINPLLHYIQCARHEQTWPNPYFDPEWYAQVYLTAHQENSESLAHFLSQSPEKLFNPNPYFDSKWYLQTYSWVRKTGMHPLQHYITFGLQEKTDPNPYFDTDWYLEQHPESVAEGLCPLAHYLDHLKQGNVNPNPYFDATWYCNTYPDVVENGAEAFLHYLVYGAKEYRDPGPYFSTSWYLENYPDIKDAGINPLHHFIRYGIFEGRTSYPDFDPDWYMNQYPDMLNSELPPLLHYIKIGKDEGNLPHDPNRNTNKINFDLIFGNPQEINDDDKYVPLLSAPPLQNKPVKLIAFYLPQFHAFPENDEWWGTGFTEWTNVRPAKPQFKGHYQPHIPGELGYYNLLDPTVQRRQVELAKIYGIEGFCFYFYWFAGKRLMETPIENFINDKSLDLSFCLCWANENWTRRWDGLDNEILIAQHHTNDDDINFIKYISKYIQDSRYIYINGKPLLIVYRPNLLPSAKETARRWRNWCYDNGIGEIYLAYVQSFADDNPQEYGFDAAIEFPPSGWILPYQLRKTYISETINKNSEKLVQEFNCSIRDWRIFVHNSSQYTSPKYQIFRGICPAWDNTARRKNNSAILLNSTPDLYQEWLKNAIEDTIKNHTTADERLIFINAWNEWAEGAHLEPDERYGYAYLDATRKALQIYDKCSPDEIPNRICIVIHAFYPEVLHDIFSNLCSIEVPYNVYITTTHEKIDEIKDVSSKFAINTNIILSDNRGRDILPFLKVLEKIKNEEKLILKIHTKRSIHRDDGDKWRKELFDNLLNPKNIQYIFNAFRNQPDLGLVAPEKHILFLKDYIGFNQKSVESFNNKMKGFHVNLTLAPFIAGSMFYVRANALNPIHALQLHENEFEVESGQRDGTLAHALERCFSLAVLKSGYYIGSIENPYIPAQAISDNYEFACQMKWQTR